MAPEMAAVYTIGLIPSALVTGAHFLLHHKKLQSPAFQQVQRNLNLEDCFWSETQGTVVALHGANAHAFEGDLMANDVDQYRRSLKVMGVVMFFLSWPGFLFHLLILISIRWLAVPRLERKIFASPLAQRDLSRPEVKALLSEFGVMTQHIAKP